MCYLSLTTNNIRRTQYQLFSSFYTNEFSFIYFTSTRSNKKNLGLKGLTDLNGFDTFAEIIVENGATSLVHNNHKFIRDRVENERSYWRCRNSFRFNCKARMVTKTINGYELMKIRNGHHDHTAKKITKNGRKKSKLKQRNPTILAKRRIPIAIPSKLPKLVPKPTLTIKEERSKAETTFSIGSAENIANNSPITVDDAENLIVDILD